MAGVPSAVTRRREQQEAELRAQGIDPNGAPPGVVVDEPAASNAAPQATAPAPVPNGNGGDHDDVAKLRARIEELEQEARTNSGRASSASGEVASLKQTLETVQDNRKFIEQQLQEVVAKNETLQQQVDELSRKSTVSETDRSLAEFTEVSDPTPGEVETFGQDSVNFVTKVARKQMAAALTPMLARLKAIEGALGRLKDLDKLPALEKTVQATTADAQRRAGDEFFKKEILAYFPDFEAVRDTEEWKAYLNREVPGRGMKVGHQLTQYHNLSEPVGIRTLIAAYYDAKKAAPNRDSLAVPDKSRTEGGPPKAKPTFKASEYQRKMRDFINKKLPKADWDAFKAEFDAALIDNRVDRDAVI